MIAAKLLLTLNSLRCITFIKSFASADQERGHIVGLSSLILISWEALMYHNMMSQTFLARSSRYVHHAPMIMIRAETHHSYQTCYTKLEFPNGVAVEELKVSVSYLIPIR